MFILRKSTMQQCTCRRLTSTPTGLLHWPQIHPHHPPSKRCRTTITYTTTVIFCCMCARVVVLRWDRKASWFKKVTCSCMRDMCVPYNTLNITINLLYRAVSLQHTRCRADKFVEAPSYFEKMLLPIWMNNTFFVLAIKPVTPSFRARGISIKPLRIDM